METNYPTMAVEIAQSLPRSSAGGELPKILENLRGGGEGRSVLVKFSATIDQPTGSRWADLLLCEFHGHEVVAGVVHPGVRLLDASGRRFLEIPRFDRIGAGGRMGVGTLEALTTARRIDLSRDWTEAAADPHRCRLIDGDSIAMVRRLSAFGELIGNTDMHSGNLASLLTETLPLRVAPAYDRLPML